MDPTILAALQNIDLKPQVKRKAGGEIINWVRQACADCECGSLLSKIDVKFSNSMTTTAGTAKRRNGRYILTLSSRLWDRMDEDEQRDLVIHEACHLIDFWLHDGNTKPHGWEWQALMRRCGINNPEDHIRHNIPCDDLRRRGTRHGYTCSCKGGTIGPIQAKKLRHDGVKYVCKNCHQHIVLTGEIT